MSCLNAEEFHRRRNVSNGRTGNIAQAGNLHFVAFQCCTVFRYDDDQHLTPRFLQFSEETVQLIEELLRTGFIVRGFALARIVVTVMQRQGVVEGRRARRIQLIQRLQPAVQRCLVVIDRGAVKALQNHRQAGLIHQRALDPAQRAKLLQEVAEDTVVAEHQLLREAQLRQVFKQIAFAARWLIKVGVRELAAAGAQQTRRRRPAVRGRRVKVFEQQVEMLPQRMIHQPGRFNIRP